jgi:hypothetical protein
MGAMVAYELAVSRAFAGPLVLLGSSLSSADEPAFFRGIVCDSFRTTCRVPSRT